jgi:subtilase-type serine protease
MTLCMGSAVVSATEVPALRLSSHFDLSGYVGARTADGASLTLPPASFETDEYRRSWFLGKINASDAYAMGYTGQGILVAVVDTGLDIFHPEFNGRVSPMARTFEFKANPGDVADLKPDGRIAGHGTHVAGIIGAARDGVGTQGVAYNATILPLRSVEVEGPPTGDPPTSLAIRYAIRQGAKVLNGSYGPITFPTIEIDDPNNPGRRIPNPNYTQLPGQLLIAFGMESEYEALKAAAAADIVLVFSAGNEYDEQPQAAANPAGIGLFPYIRPENHQGGVYRFLAGWTDLQNPSTYQILDPSDPSLQDVDLSDLQGALITVVATGRDNTIASYSNRCGVTFLWCLAAPGGDGPKNGESREDALIESTMPYSAYGLMAGTSMAAPVVSGGAAILREAFPYMTARQIIELILTTTDVIGPREIYGRGLFNLGRAVRGPREFGAEGFAQTFDVNTRGHDSVWSNDIIGLGALVKRGDGNLVLTGANTYAGGTDVLGGILTLTGSVASPMNIGAAATLRGTGRIDAPLRLAGTLEPGGFGSGSIGTLNVAGRADLLQGSTYRVDANGQGLHDRLVVGGAAALAGGSLELVLANGLAPAETPLEIVTSAGETTGVFGSLRTNSISAFLDPRVQYTASGVTVSFDRNGVAFASAATTLNNARAAAALDTIGSSGQFDNAVMRLDAVSADQAFSLLTGEAHGGAAASAYGDARLVQDTLLGRLRAPFGISPVGQVRAAFAADRPGVQEQPVAVPYPSLDPRRFNLWGEGFGSWGRVRSNGNAATLDTSTGGFILGAEANIEQTYRIGLAGGFTRTVFDLDGRLSSGVNEGVFGAIYGSSQWGAIALRLGASYAGQDIDTDRTITFPGFADRTSASYGGSMLQAFGEVGYRFDLARAQIEPFVGASALRLHTDGFVENGGLAALVGYGRSYELGTATLGVRAQAQLSEEVPVMLKGMLGWRHAFGDVVPEALLAFRDGAAPFTVSGAPVDRNALVAQAGLDWQPTRDVSLGVSYTGQVGPRAQDHAVKGNLTWYFETR